MSILKKYRLPLIISAVLFAVSVTAVALWGVRSSKAEEIGEPPVFEDAVSESSIISSNNFDLTWRGWQNAKTAACEVYTSPSYNASAKGTLAEGTDVVLIGRINGFFKIRMGLKNGWIKESCILPGEPLPESLPAVYSPDAPRDITDSSYGAALSELCKKYGGTGIQAAVIENGAVAYTFEYGYADREKKRAVTPDTKYRVASLSKAIIGIDAMALYDLGKLDLDTDLGVYHGAKVRNPSFPNTPITLRNFLTHTSSLRIAPKYDKDKRPLLSSKDSYTSNAPGTKETYCYNNAAYEIAGMMIEKASKLTVADFMNRYFAPLDIDASFYYGLIEKKEFGKLYLGGTVSDITKNSFYRMYSDKPGALINSQHYAGGYISSAKDAAKLFSLLANDGAYNGVSYISPQTVEEMQKVHYSFSGFDQCITLRHKSNIYGGREIYYHTGNSSGMLALASYCDAEKSGVVVLTSGAPQKKDENGLYECCSKITGYCYENIIGSGLYEEVYG